MLDSSKFTYSDSRRNTNQPNINNSNTKVFSLNKNQFSVFARSMFISGLSYLLLCGLSIAAAVLFEKTIKTDWSLFQALAPIFAILIFISAILSGAWTSIIAKRSLPFAISVYIFTILANALAFGWFASASQLLFNGSNVTLLLICFGVGAIILLIAGLIASILGWKGTLALSKIYMSLSIGLMVVMLVSFIAAPLIFVYGGFNFLQWWYFLVYAFFGVYIFINVIFDIKKVQKTSEFIKISDTSDKKEITFVSLYCGYLLLSSFIRVVWIVVMLFTRLSNVRK